MQESNIRVVAKNVGTVERERKRESRILQKCTRRK